MQVTVYNLEGKETKKINLPDQFGEEIRPEIVKRAVLSILANSRQPYGAKPTAGKRYSAKISRRRRNYKGSYGYGISRSPRKILSRRGTRFYWVGAFAPNTVGGRRSHPPKSDKIWSLGLNKKERRLAIRSALAAVVTKEIVAARGHIVPNNYPFVVVNDFESINKTKDVSSILSKLGFDGEMARGKITKVRAGKGKARGRKHITKKSLLIVVSGTCTLLKSARNIPGVDVVDVHVLNANHLAPGTHLGRITLFTDKAIEEMNNKKLFM